jgi:hypothetical protein
MRFSAARFLAWNFSTAARRRFVVHDQRVERADEFGEIPLALNEVGEEISAVCGKGLNLIENGLPRFEFAGERDAEGAVHQVSNLGAPRHANCRRAAVGPASACLDGNSQRRAAESGTRLGNPLWLSGLGAVWSREGTGCLPPAMGPF